MEGALINVMPGNMSSYRLRDCPDLVAMLKRLNRLRKRFLPFFTEGQFHFREGLAVNGGEARLYTHGERHPGDRDQPDRRAGGGVRSASIRPPGVVRRVDGTLTGSTSMGRRCERHRRRVIRRSARTRLARNPTRLCIYAFHGEA